MEKKSLSEKTLEEYKNLYLNTVESPFYKDWYDKARTNRDYYEGIQSIPSDFVEQFNEIGGKYIKDNFIRPAIADNLSFILRSGRSLSFKPSDELNMYYNLATYMQNYYVLNMRKNDHLTKSCLKIEDMLICGIGWSHMGYDGKSVFYDHKPALNMFWDLNDSSPRLENIMFAGSFDFVPKDDFLNSNLNHKDYSKFKKYVESQTEISKKDDKFQNLEEDTNDWFRDDTIKVVTIYRKKIEKYYSTKVLLEDEGEEVSIDTVYNSFDREYIESLSSDGNIDEHMGTRIYKCQFIENHLIYEYAIDEQSPNQKQLPYQPVVFNISVEGKPKAIVSDLIDLQDAYNYHTSAMHHYLDCKTLILSGGGNGQNSENILMSDAKKVASTFRKESHKKFGVLKIPSALKYTIQQYDNSIQERKLILDDIINRKNNLMRIHGDYVGRETNRVSGVAINSSANNNINSQSFFLLAHEYMLIQEGGLFVNVVKNIENINDSFYIHKDGKTVKNTIDEKMYSLDFQIYLSLSGNQTNTLEENKSIFMDILNSPSRDLLLSSPIFLNKRGISESESYILYKEFQRVMQGSKDKETVEQEEEVQDQQTMR